MALFGASNKHPGWTCIDVLARSVDVARVVPGSGGKPEVVVCDSYQKEGGDHATLTRLRRALRLDDGPCTTLLAPGQYQVLQIDTPRVPDAELKAALRWQIRDMLSFPAESATVDAVPVPASGPTQRHLVVAASNDTIAAVMQTFDAARIDLAVIDIPELAQRNVARLFEEPGRALAMLVFDSEDPLLTFTAGGELCQSRRIELLSPGIVAANEAQRRGHYERLVLELQRSLDNYDRQLPGQRVSRLIVAGVPGAEDLLPYLETQLGMPVAALALDGVLDCSRIPELAHAERRTQCVHMIGAALREGLS